MSSDGGYYIVEYGVGDKDAKNDVSAYPLLTRTDLPAASFVDRDMHWDKQGKGVDVSSLHLTVDGVANHMRAAVADHDYDPLRWNCHMAQENTRRRLGLRVDFPYNDGKYRE